MLDFNLLLHAQMNPIEKINWDFQFFQKQFWENFTSPHQKAFMKTCSPTFYLQTKSHLHISSQESTALLSKILSFYCSIFVSVLFQGSTAFPSNSEVGFSTERKRTSADFRLRDSIRNFKSSFVSGSARHDHRLHRLQVGGRVTGRLQRRTLSKLSRFFFWTLFSFIKKFMNNLIKAMARNQNPF